MVQETQRIMDHIETEREQLGENLDEFESRIKDATSPRAWYESNPGAILGAAAVGGLILGLLVTSRSGSKSEPAEFSEFADLQAKPEKRHKGSESRHMKTIKNTFDTTIAALVGLGARKFQDFVAGSLPGFREQYDEASQQQAAWDASNPGSTITH